MGLRGFDSKLAGRRGILDEHHVAFIEFGRAFLIERLDAFSRGGLELLRLSGEHLFVNQAETHRRGKLNAAKLVSCVVFEEELQPRLIAKAVDMFKLRNLIGHYVRFVRLLRHHG